MLRSVLALFAFFALLGVSSGCLTKSQWKSIIKPANKESLKVWAKAKTSKQCDKAMVYFMKKDMHPVSMENAQSFVQMTFESLKEMQSNKGNVENSINAYVKKCASKGYDEAMKELGYPKFKGSALEKCIKKHRKVEDWDGTIKFTIDQGFKVMQDEKTMVPILMALMKQPEVKPIVDLAQGALCAN